MRHKYREDYWANVSDCLDYADVYLDDLEHTEIMRSFKTYIRKAMVSVLYIMVRRFS